MSQVNNLAQRFLEATVERRGTNEKEVYAVLKEVHDQKLTRAFEETVYSSMDPEKRDDLLKEAGPLAGCLSSKTVSAILKDELSASELRVADSFYATGGTSSNELRTAEGISVTRFLGRLGLGVGSGVGGTMAGAAVGTMICPVVGTIIGALVGGVLGGGGGEIAAQKLIDGEKNIRWGAVVASGLLGGLSGGAGALTTIVAKGALQLGEGALIQSTFKTAQFISASDKTGIIGIGQRAAVSGGQSVIATGIEAAAGERKLEDLADPVSLAISVLMGETIFRGITAACVRGLHQSHREHAPEEKSAALMPLRSLSHQETLNGHPLLEATEYRRFYETDTRALGETATATFDFQGFVHENRTGFESEGQTFYVDSMATNGILKGPEHPGIHIGTDGVRSYSVLAERMKTGKDIGEYDIYISIPGKLQRAKGVVANYEDCYSQGEYRERFEATAEDIVRLHESPEETFAIRLRMDPKTDPLAREKVQLIHTALVHFIERGGPLNQITEFVYSLEEQLVHVDASELARRRLQEGL